MLIDAKITTEINKLKGLLSKNFAMKNLGAPKKIFEMEDCRDSR